MAVPVAAVPVAAVPVKAPVPVKPAAPEIPPLSVAPEKKSMIGNFFNPKK